MIPAGETVPIALELTGDVRLAPWADQYVSDVFVRIQVAGNYHSMPPVYLAFLEPDAPPEIWSEEVRIERAPRGLLDSNLEAHADDLGVGPEDRVLPPNLEVLPFGDTGLTLEEIE